MDFYPNQEIEYISQTNRIVRRGRFNYKSGKIYSVTPYPFVDNYPIRFSMEIPEFVVDKVKVLDEEIEVKTAPIWPFPTYYKYINLEANNI